MKTCIFDLDGTLTDTISAIAHFGNLALSECGFSGFETDRYKLFVGDGRTKLIERMRLAQDALTDESFKAVCTVYDRYYEADPLYDTRAYEGIEELIKKLKAMGVQMAVCSNKPDNVVHDVIKKVFGEGYFDVIISNPPYIRSDVIPTLMPEVRDHEPRTALDGDADGLRFYRVIAREASSYLKRRGRLYLETGYDEAEAVTGLLKENGFTDVEALKDYSGNYRVIKCCRGDR